MKTMVKSSGSWFKVRSGKLPLEYTELEYIQSSGSQYINTGYKWTSEVTTIEADFTVNSNTSSQSLWGNEEYYSGSSRYFSGVPHGSNGNYSYYIGTGGLTGFSVTIGTRTKIEISTIATKKYTIKKDGAIVIDSHSYSGTVQAGTATPVTENRGKIYIFCNHNSSAAGTNAAGTQYVGGMTLYSFKMWDNSVLVRNLIPAKRNADGAIGLYDLVEKEFHPNQVNTSFTAGTSKSAVYRFNSGINNDYYHLEYIASTGTQRIKLPIIPTSKYKIESVFAITNKGVTSCIWCARGTSTNDKSTTAFYIANSSVRCDYGISAAMTNIGNIDANKKYRLTMDSEKWYLDGVLKTSMAAAQFTSGSAIQLFASHYKGQDANLGNYARMRLYSFKVWNENRELVMNLIPVLRKSDNVAGLFDTIGHGFYTNDGSGSFTASTSHFI